MNIRLTRLRLPTAAAALLTAALALVLGGCDAINNWLHPPPDIKFAPAGVKWSEKPDFAMVEHDYPLTTEELAKLTPKNIVNYSQEQLDQIYARLTAGPIPDGAFNGDLIFPMGETGDRRLSEIVGGLPGFAVELKLHRIEDLGRTLWKGKVFYRKERVLRNRIEDFTLLRPIVDNPDKVRRITVDGKEQWLLFPARLYCGQSLLDGRRESIIIDYAFTDLLPGYQAKPDALAGRNGLQIRDEIRMVRPGFYLGRAYTGRVFLLNFVLYNEAIAERDGPAFMKTGAVNEDCWAGEQARQIVANK
ncbi:MAG: hypothetical protein LJE97_02740 [Betaproteobacteria bacterium]|jgi:hypothetical protein|nr:hypothetical protein [Betaproteobacteria bacterium]